MPAILLFVSAHTCCPDAHEYAPFLQTLAGAQAVPMVSIQAPLHKVKPVLHLDPHVLFTHATSAFGSDGAGQAVHDVPQVAGELSSAQVVWLQR